MIDMQTGRSYGADVCYGFLSCYKQVAPDGAHACPRENGEWGEVITQRHEAAKNKTEVESLRRWEVGNPNLSDEAA